MMKRYDKYKDTNIEWIGEIPEHWEVKRMKNIGELYSGLSGKSGKDFKQPENPNNKPYIPFSNIANNEKIDPDFLDFVVMNEDDNQNQVQKGDLFFLMSSENYDDVGKSSYLESELGEAYLNSFCKGFRMFEKSVDPSFLNWLLLSQPHRCRLMIEANGFTRINLKQDKIRDFYIYTPPLSEQIQISSYLDNKTSLIDKLVNNNKKLIKLLEEKRTALINKVITKGLDPNVKMKDSGIEWIGKIPEHWKVGQIRYWIELLTDFTANGSFASLAENVNYKSVPDYARLIRLTDIRKDLINKEGVWIDEHAFEFLAKSKLFGGEILVANVGAYSGSSFRLPRTLNFKASLGPNMFLLKFNRKFINEDFIKYSLDAYYTKSQLVLKAMSSAQPKLNKEDIRGTYISFPELKEQNRIVSYLDNEVMKIDSLSHIVKKQMLFLKEYRQSLISNVVTGKIKVDNL